MRVETDERSPAMRKIMSGKKPALLHANERGMTIIELMVATTIGLFVLSVVGYAYISNKDSWKFNDQEARLQDRGRYIMSLLNADLRLAGFNGCIRGTDPDDFSMAPAAGLASGFGKTELAERLRDGVRVASDAATGTTTTLNIFAPIEGGNFMQHADSAVEATSIASTRLTPEMLAMGHVSPAGAPSSVQFVLIDDCQNMPEFVSVAALDPATGSIHMAGATAPHKKDSVITWYDWGGAAGLDGIVYTFADNKLRRNGHLLADNVESFRVCLGQDGNGADTIDIVNTVGFGTAASNFALTRSVHVDLVLASALPVLDQPTTAAFNFCDSSTPGWTAASADRRLRRLFSTSVTLRNKAR
ncbi:MAG: PilW family protein [Zoogloeaceae bacterium]|jgi:type IV pilus assembly protein PilW|nr:PilW family protein [Zoogloeaceae bacterium]